MRENLRVRDTPEEYDHYTGSFTEEYDRGLIHGLLGLYRQAGSPAGSLVDIGTGTARVLVRIAAEPELAGLRLIGTEYFDEMVARARDTVRRCGLEERIEIVADDIHRTAFADDSVTCVLSRSTIHHWAEPVRALAQIYRILEPGGFALIHEMRRDPEPSALAEFNRRRAAAGVGPTTLDEKYTTAELSELLHQAGLAETTELVAPRSGPGAVGVAITIRKPERAR